MGLTDDAELEHVFKLVFGRPEAIWCVVSMWWVTSCCTGVYPRGRPESEGREL